MLRPAHHAEAEYRGTIYAQIEFPAYPGYYLAMMERVDMRLGDPRVEYSYHLIGPAGRIWGYDRDEKKAPQLKDHYHPGDGERRPATVSLGGAIKKAWETLQSGPLQQLPFENTPE